MTDIDLIHNPSQWPRWPMLPLKQFRKDGLRVGFILAVEAPPYVVYLGSLYDIEELEYQPNTWVDAVADLKTLSYGTVEALVNEWRID